MFRGFVIAIGVALFLLGAPALTWAKPRVAIVPFERDNSGELADVVAELLDDDFNVVSSSKTSRTIDKLGYDTDLTSKQLKKLSNELETDAIIRGDVGKKNGRKVLHLKLFKDGKKVRGFKVEFASMRSKKFKQALKDKLLEKLGDGEAPKKKKGGDDEEVADEKPKKKKGGDDEEVADEKPTKKKGGDDEEVADEKPKKKKGGDDEEVADEKPRKKKKGGDDVDGEEASTGDDEDPDAKPKKKVGKGGDDEGNEDEDPIEGEVEDRPRPPSTGHAINRAAVRVDFGPSVSRRSLMFTSRSFEEAPRPYANTPVPGAHVEAEIYPLAFSNPKSIAAGLGIGGHFDQTLTLNLTSTVQPGTKFPVKQNHWSINGRFRLVLGKRTTSPSATIRGGYMTRTFTVDRSRLMTGNVIDLPDVAYKGFNGGLDFRFPVSRSVALSAGGGMIFVTTTGAIQSREQYGQAKVTGAEARVGVDVAIGKRMAIRASGDFAQMGFAFTGSGEMSNNRDGNPETKDVGGAADRYIGGSLLFGVLY
jgi:hypothetical protein